MSQVFKVVVTVALLLVRRSKELKNG